MRHHTAPHTNKTMPTKKHRDGGKITGCPPVAAIIGTVACFTDPRALFTDAVMSVKTPQPYCRLVLEAPKAMFLHRRSVCIKEPPQSAPLYNDLKSRCVTEETYQTSIGSRLRSLHRLSNVGEESWVSSPTFARTVGEDSCRSVKKHGMSLRRRSNREIKTDALNTALLFRQPDKNPSL